MVISRPPLTIVGPKTHNSQGRYPKFSLSLSITTSWISFIFHFLETFSFRYLMLKKNVLHPQIKYLLKFRSYYRKCVLALARVARCQCPRKMLRITGYSFQSPFEASWQHSLHFLSTPSKNCESRRANDTSYVTLSEASDWQILGIF